MLHDVFICHASEDKESFVRPLAEKLRASHLEVWYDEFTLTVGDSLRQAIDRGLAESRYGIVVCSPAFFRKGWPQRELNGLVAREIAEERRLILPIWHEIDRDEILRYSPPLADVVAISSARGLDYVLDQLLRRLRPEISPLIVARDFLIEKGVVPPVISDEWWLDIVEIKESQFQFPDGTRSWIFPLPFRELDRGKERGLNIAWTALQTDWAADGEERRICQLTHPETVHEFLHSWPGLFECARANPGTLALYVPQLTLPGYDNGLADVFDPLLDPARGDAYQSPGYGGPPETTDGGKPSCGELIAWRHPTFGNYIPRELAYSFVSAHDLNYNRKSYSCFQCMTWLLAPDAAWMPEPLRETLIKGMRDRDLWLMDLLGQRGKNSFVSALIRQSRKTFRVTRQIRAALDDLFELALHELRSTANPTVIAERFLTYDFVNGYYAWHDEIAERRRRKS